MTYFLSFIPLFLLILPTPKGTIGDSSAGVFSTIILTPDHNSQEKIRISDVVKAFLDFVLIKLLFLFPGLHEL